MISIKSLTNQINDYKHLKKIKNRIATDNLCRIKALILIKTLKMNYRFNQIIFNKQNNHTKKSKVYIELKIKLMYLKNIIIQMNRMRIYK